MARLAAMIYPSTFQTAELIGSIKTAFPSDRLFQYYRYKNLELGVFETTIATNTGKTIWATLDGKLQDVSMLREELKKHFGFHFNEKTDAEIIVYAYEAWSENFLKHIHGSFALALFDEEKETLFIARDRLGQKPLYWTFQGNYWLFSTEIKGLLASGIVPQTPSREALASFLYFGFIPQDISPIHGVNKLLPGHYLKVDLKRQIFIGQHWSLSRQLEHKKDYSSEEVYHQFGNLFESATQACLAHDQNIGTFLMGNLGSSAVSWFLSHKIRRDNVHTFSAGFDEPNPVELKNAREIAQALSLSHEVKEIKPEEVLEELPSIVWHLDEPIADLYAIQTWYLAKLASQKCRHAITDMGWVEMLAGHTRYFAEPQSKTPLAFHLAQLPIGLRNKLILPFFKFIYPEFKYRILRNIEIDRHQLSYLIETSLFKERPRKKASPRLFPFFDPEVFTQRFHRLAATMGEINPSLYYDIKTALPDRILLQYERLSSAHKVEVSSPYLYAPLVDFLAEIPESIKFSKPIPAILLHELMERLCHKCPIFPERKSSFLDTWRKNGKFRRVFAELANGRLVEEGLISAKWIKQQLGYPYLIPQTFHQLWAILILEIWFRIFITRPLDFPSSQVSVAQILKIKL